MIIQSKRVWIQNQFIPAQIEIDEDKIINISKYNNKNVDIDYGNNRILPGFIDIHTHGAYKFDTNDANPEGLRNWMLHIVEEGVTSVCPTTITQSEEVLTMALENVKKVVEEGYNGAEIVGVHLEGPYLDNKYKGAQPEQFIVKPNVEQFKKYQVASGNLIKVITMACEHDDDFALTKYCVDNGILVSQGHSGATYEEALMAIANGANSMTHVYNGMSPLHHREPGLVGAAYRCKNVYGEIICDGNHSNINSINNYFMSKGADYAIMITDSLMAKGCPIGSKHVFGGNEIEVYPDGSAHLVEAKALAGSTLKMNEGLKIVIEQAQVPIEYAINSCTINPARAIKIDDHKGIIKYGYDADMVVLDDEYKVVNTFAKGIKY